MNLPEKVCDICTYFWRKCSGTSVENGVFTTILHSLVLLEIYGFIAKCESQKDETIY